MRHKPLVKVNGTTHLPLRRVSFGYIHQKKIFISPVHRGHSKNYPIKSQKLENKRSLSRYRTISSSILSTTQLFE